MEQHAHQMLRKRGLLPISNDPQKVNLRTDKFKYRYTQSGHVNKIKWVLGNLLFPGNNRSFSSKSLS